MSTLTAIDLLISHCESDCMGDKRSEKVDIDRSTILDRVRTLDKENESFEACQVKPTSRSNKRTVHPKI